MKQDRLCLFLATLLFFAFPSLLFGGSATLRWQSNTDPDLAGYRIYYGTQSRSYGSPVSVDKSATTYTINNLPEGSIYFFALTAVDTSGNESAYSKEVSKTMTATSTSVLLTDYLQLPAAGAYGMIKDGDQTHPNEVNFAFSVSAGSNLVINFEVWDIDHPNEVQIQLNGYALEYVRKTVNDKWGKMEKVALPEEYLKKDGINIVRFNNTYNPPNTYWWGVRNISLLEDSGNEGLQKGRKK
jgi:hypothetical protein